MSCVSSMKDYHADWCIDMAYLVQFQNFEDLSLFKQLYVLSGFLYVVVRVKDSPDRFTIWNMGLNKMSFE